MLYISEECSPYIYFHSPKCFRGFPLEIPHVKPTKAVIPAVPIMFLKEFWKGERYRLLLSLSQTISSFWVRMPEPCMGIMGSTPGCWYKWPTGCTQFPGRDPGASSGLCVLFPTCSLVPVLPFSPSLKWRGKRREGREKYKKMIEPPP